MEKDSTARQNVVIVVPCYNEEAVLSETHARLTAVCRRIEQEHLCLSAHLLYVDDGSRDATWQMISEFASQDKASHGLRLSHNCGHQHALWAGLEWAAHHAEAAVSIDADLQDDVDVILQMVQRWQSGVDIVYGVRSERKTDTFFKRFTAEGFYRIMNKMGCNLIFNHADYRLVSSKVLQEFSNFKEVNLFLRGMFPMVGFNSSIVYYERDERKAGQSHYPLAKMISFAIDGITSLTTFPIRIITFIGIIVSMFSFIGIIWALVTHAMGNTVDGWASIICIVLLMSGIQLLSLGVIGEYVGKIFEQGKNRPIYIAKETLTWEE